MHTLLRNMQAYLNNGKFLDKAHWFRISSAGNLQRKRVSAKDAQVFPLHYRIIFQQQGATELTKHIMYEDNCSLSDISTSVMRRCICEGIQDPKACCRPAQGAEQDSQSE